MYYNGACGVKKDVKRAFVLSKLAAEQGDANAQFNLGTMYLKGDGTKPDVKRAVELITLSAEQGLAKAHSLSSSSLSSSSWTKQFRFRFRFRHRIPQRHTHVFRCLTIRHFQPQFHHFNSCASLQIFLRRTQQIICQRHLVREAARDVVGGCFFVSTKLSVSYFLVVPLHYIDQ